MTVNRRAARALHHARELLRDAAVAEHASRSDHQMRAQELRDAARLDLEDALDAAVRSLEAASSVDQLHRVSRELEIQHLRADDADAAFRAARDSAEETAALLRERSRQAYCAAQLADRAERTHCTHELRQEQHRHDDLRPRPARDTVPR